MKKQNIKTEQDLYLYETESSTIGFFTYSAITTVIAIILAIFRLWLPLAVLFFSYLMGLFSGIEWNKYDTYQKKFREKFKK